ncbi:hypothetical protein SESBI_30023 [Sesbania bispinosa]|nr:hypothetical protein SESBI_30023 [Sesbania bispinosa]
MPACYTSEPLGVLILPEPKSDVFIHKTDYSRNDIDVIKRIKNISLQTSKEWKGSK